MRIEGIFISTFGSVEHFLVEYGSLGEARERYGVDASVGVEETLLFEGRT